MRWRCFVILSTVLLLVAAAPSDKYNLPVQRRTRDCVTMNQPAVPLRFADGTPTGFYARADDPSQQGENQPDCPKGTMEIDAHEIITTAEGVKLYFHPGGGPGHYNDHVENGQYGHVAIDDLKSPPAPKPTGNGAAAPLSPLVYFVEPTQIPRDMFYKPNANAEGRTGSTYYTYGNPGYDKTGGRGDWTYLNWSWVQNGKGDKFPENKCNGGGMVRAMVQRGDAFLAADVTPILGYAYGPDNQVNGRVTAIYGKLAAGNKGAPIFGWIPLCYQKTNDVIVPLLRRAPAPMAALDKMPATASGDVAERMAINLIWPVAFNKPKLPDELRARWMDEYSRLADRPLKMEVITRIARIDDASSVQLLMRQLLAEKDSRLREQIIVMLGFMSSTPAEMKTVVPAFFGNYRLTRDPRERLKTIDVISNIPAPESIDFLRKLRPETRDKDELAAIEYGLLKRKPAN